MWNGKVTLPSLSFVLCSDCIVLMKYFLCLHFNLDDISYHINNTKIVGSFEFIFFFDFHEIECDVHQPMHHIFICLVQGRQCVGHPSSRMHFKLEIDFAAQLILDPARASLDFDPAGAFLDCAGLVASKLHFCLCCACLRTSQPCWNLPVWMSVSRNSYTSSSNHWNLLRRLP